MRLTIIGCSGSCPGPDSPASCYLVEAEGFRLVIDLGNGALGGLQRQVSLDAVDAICLSHLHADHCLDLCGYAVRQTWAPGGPRSPIPVLAPAGAAERLGRAMAARTGADADDGIIRAFSFTALAPGAAEIGPLRLTLAHMNHPVETFGFRVEHAGRVIAYSADTGPSAALPALARGADLMLCEASFAEPSGGAAALPPDLHLTARQAGEHARRAGAARLVLTHLPPWNDRQRSIEEASASFDGPVQAAETGWTWPG